MGTVHRLIMDKNLTYTSHPWAVLEIISIIESKGWLTIKYPTGEYAISPQPVV